MWIALIPMLAWGSIGLISGKMGGDANQQTLGMTWGALLFALLTTALSWQHFMSYNTPKLLLVGLVSGLCWSLGQYNQFVSMKAIGVSKTMPISTGAQLVFTTLVGALFFHEWTTGKMLILGFLALALLVLGVIFTAMRDKSDTAALARSQKEDWSLGMKALVLSTLGYVLYTVLVKLFNVDTQAMVLPQACGMVIGALLFALKPNAFQKATYKNMFTGLVWGTGNFCMFQATALVGLAVSFSLAQSGLVISTFGSIFLLGEKKTKKEMVYVVIGSCLIILGSIILGLLK